VAGVSMRAASLAASSSPGYDCPDEACTRTGSLSTLFSLIEALGELGQMDSLTWH